MSAEKSVAQMSSPEEGVRTPSHAHHIVESTRTEEDHDTTGLRRIRVSGVDMANIFRTFRGRLNASYWKPSDNHKVCEDAMELMDEIDVWIGCEPTVVISYVALVREIYSHACANVKLIKMSDEKREGELIEQWRQIERHFLKIKPVMDSCWPIGNETDLVTVYLSLALLYSLYKDICREDVIEACYEAAERARRCGTYRLSKSEFNEVQQYCDAIENIYFLRNQHISNGHSHFVKHRSASARESSHAAVRNGDGTHPAEHDADQHKLADGKEVLAEYAVVDRSSDKTDVNGGVFVATETVTVETFEKRELVDEPMPRTPSQPKKPSRQSRKHPNRKVMVENYAIMRLSHDEPASLKRAVYSKHKESLRSRSVEQISHPLSVPNTPSYHRAVSQSSDLPAPFPVSSMSRSTDALTTHSTGFSEELYGATELHSTKESKSTSGSVSEQQRDFVLDSEMLASMLQSKTDFSGEQTPSTPSPLPSPPSEDETPHSPEVRSPPPVAPRSPSSLLQSKSRQNAGITLSSTTDPVPMTRTLTSHITKSTGFEVTERVVESQIIETSLHLDLPANDAATTTSSIPLPLPAEPSPPVPVSVLQEPIALPVPSNIPPPAPPPPRILTMIEPTVCSEVVMTSTAGLPLVYRTAKTSATELMTTAISPELEEAPLKLSCLIRADAIEDVKSEDSWGNSSSPVPSEHVAFSEAAANSLRGTVSSSIASPETIPRSSPGAVSSAHTSVSVSSSKIISETETIQSAATPSSAIRKAPPVPRRPAPPPPVTSLKVQQPSHSVLLDGASVAPVPLPVPISHAFPLAAPVHIPVPCLSEVPASESSSKRPSSELPRSLPPSRPPVSAIPSSSSQQAFTSFSTVAVDSARTEVSILSSTSQSGNRSASTEILNVTSPLRPSAPPPPPPAARGSARTTRMSPFDALPASAQPLQPLIASSVLSPHDRKSLTSSLVSLQSMASEGSELSSPATVIEAPSEDVADIHQIDSASSMSDFPSPPPEVASASPVSSTTPEPEEVEAFDDTSAHSTPKSHEVSPSSRLTPQRSPISPKARPSAPPPPPPPPHQTSHSPAYQMPASNSSSMDNEVTSSSQVQKISSTSESFGIISTSRTPGVIFPSQTTEVAFFPETPKVTSTTTVQDMLPVSQGFETISVSQTSSEDTSASQVERLIYDEPIRQNQLEVIQRPTLSNENAPASSTSRSILSSAMASKMTVSSVDSSIGPLSPFRSPLSARRPLHPAAFSPPSIEGRSIDFDQLLRGFQTTSHPFEQGANIDSGLFTSESSRLTRMSGESASVSSQHTLLGSHQQLNPRPALYAVTTMAAEATVTRESETKDDTVVSVHTDDTVVDHIGDQRSDQDATAESIPTKTFMKGQNLPFLTELLKEHEMSAKKDSRRHVRFTGDFSKKTPPAKAIDNENECDTSLATELATSWVAQSTGEEEVQMTAETSGTEHDSESWESKQVRTEQDEPKASHDMSILSESVPQKTGVEQSAGRTSYGDIYDNEDEEEDFEDFESYIGEGLLTAEEVEAIIARERELIAKLHREAQRGEEDAETGNSLVYRIPTYSAYDVEKDPSKCSSQEVASLACTNDTKGLHDQEDGHNSKKTNVQLIGEESEEPKGSAKEFKDASQLESFSGSRRSALTEGYQSEQHQSRLDVELREPTSIETETETSLQKEGSLRASSFLADISRSLATDNIYEGTQITSSAYEHSEQATSEFLETLPEGSIEKNSDDENSVDEKDDSKKVSQGFAPMHEEIVSAKSTLRHVTDLPSHVTADISEGKFDVPRPEKPFASQRDSEGDKDDGASNTSPIPQFNPMLEFERRIKMKGQRKTAVDVAVVSKDTYDVDAALHRFSGLRSSYHAPDTAQTEDNRTEQVSGSDSVSEQETVSSKKKDSEDFYETVHY